MQDRKRLEQSIESDERVKSLTDDLDTLFELAREGENVNGDIQRDLKSYGELLERLETAMLLSGENDGRSAIVTIALSRSFSPESSISVSSCSTSSAYDFMSRWMSPETSSPSRASSNSVSRSSVRRRM